MKLGPLSDLLDDESQEIALFDYAGLALQGT
jgi:hypothetical protein